ncbi:MAG: hypothetical protein GY732_14920, partial [Gammaproteobacteria bacterium]|nr:hypothetical protein [Gammaproteobacteria bacterium]
GTVAGAVAEDGTLIANGVLTISDVDSNDNPISFNDEAGVAGDNSYGTFAISGNAWSYTLDNAHPSVQALDVGESLNDTHTFTATDGSIQEVTITIDGAEDAPVLGGTVTGAVIEDGALIANGVLTISDVDTSDNPIGFDDVVSTTGDNGYGSFVLSSGAWTYTLNNAHAGVNALDDGANLTDTITYTATDGSTQTVTVTIHGTNDAPVITVPATPGANENTPLIINGLSIADAEGQSQSVTLTITDGTMTLGSTAGLSGLVGDGTNSLSFSGSLAAINGAISALTYSPSLNYVGTTTITVTSNDGALGDNKAFTIVVGETNNQPSVSDVDEAATEDGVGVVANFVVSDGDPGDLHTFVIDDTGLTEGSVVNNNDGSFTFNPGADFQDLDAGQTREVSFTYTAIDDSGAANDTSAPAIVTITVTGTEDAPVVGGMFVGLVAEDGTLIANGVLTISDVDSNDNPVSFNDEAGVAGDNNYGTFAISGNAWSYTLDNAHPAVQALDV